ncbi:Flp family type IVb pilin [uncultured Brevundimonas sp.]|uniref:Flp family type IVb pilin n=1 Tax=uncultured Brevundimonas sp. TaxID=213418 RepID=UPI0025D85539|nr:Flp family type IVb pilin [uncultured Brevundimonas sp.]
MRNFIKNFANDESGATAIEYGLIAALMAVAIIACLTAFGPQMKAGLTKIGTDMSSPQDVTAG